MLKKYLSPLVLIVIVFALATTLHSCSKLASALSYSIPLQSGSITIVIPPTSDTSSEISSATVTNSIKIDSIIKANTGGVLSTSNITSAKVSSCSLSITSGADSANNFANFESISSSFSSTSNTTAYTISMSNPDSYNTSLSIPVDTTTNIASYISGTSFSYSVSGKLRRATTDTIKCTVQFAFVIKVNG